MKKNEFPLLLRFFLFRCVYMIEFSVIWRPSSESFLMRDDRC